MKQRLLISTVVVAVAFLAVILIDSLRHRVPLFHGKPESLWIRQISNSDDSQIRVWRDFGPALVNAGPEGIGVLTNLIVTGSRPVGDQSAWALSMATSKPEAVRVQSTASRAVNR